MHISGRERLCSSSSVPEWGCLSTPRSAWDASIDLASAVYTWPETSRCFKLMSFSWRGWGRGRWGGKRQGKGLRKHQESLQLHGWRRLSWQTSFSSGLPKGPSQPKLSITPDFSIPEASVSWTWGCSLLLLSFNQGFTIKLRLGVFLTRHPSIGITGTYHHATFFFF